MRPETSGVYVHRSSIATRFSGFHTIATRAVSLSQSQWSFDSNSNFKTVLPPKRGVGLGGSVLCSYNRLSPAADMTTRFNIPKVHSNGSQLFRDFSCQRLYIYIYIYIHTDESSPSQVNLKTSRLTIQKTMYIYIYKQATKNNNKSFRWPVDSFKALCAKLIRQEKSQTQISRRSAIHKDTNNHCNIFCLLCTQISCVQNWTAYKLRNHSNMKPLHISPLINTVNSVA